MRSAPSGPNAEDGEPADGRTPADSTPADSTVAVAERDEQAEQARDDVPDAPAASPKRRLIAFVRHEWTLVTLAAVALACWQTWPTLKHPASTVPDVVGDPQLVAWIMAWPGHILTTDPMRLWQGNVFYPEPDTFAFTDSLLGYLPLSFIGSGPAAALVRYNVAYVLAAVFAFLGAYALAKQLGSRWVGAAVAGAVFAYAPWRLGQAAHLHVISTGGIALALAALAKGHGYSFRHGYRPETARPGWAAAGWGLATWQLSIGFGIGLPFAYVLALVCVGSFAGWLVAGRPPIARKVLAADLLGGLGFATVALLLARPYLRVAEANPQAVRTPDELAEFSPPFEGFYTAPATSVLWGERQENLRELLAWPNEMALLPGFVALVLAAAGLLLSSWSIRQRVALAAVALVTVPFAMGTEAWGGGEWFYLALYQHLPGWDALRTPGRLIIYPTLLIGLLAAGLLTWIAERMRVTGTTLRVTAVVLLLVPTALVLYEGRDDMEHPTMPARPEVLADVRGPAVILPMIRPDDQFIMVWTTDGFPQITNGISGFTPESQNEFRRATWSFPDRASVDYLQEHGIRTVIVMRDNAKGTKYEHALTDGVAGLPVRRQEKSDGVIFTIEP